eukprot:scaffold95189_cov66-Phaeocystis_antarctica.AAC.1
MSRFNLTRTRRLANLIALVLAVMPRHGPGGATRGASALPTCPAARAKAVAGSPERWLAAGLPALSAELTVPPRSVRAWGYL